MFIDTCPGLYPTILVHRSHVGQLAIGGAMINRIYDDREIAIVNEITPTNGGWATRFDGGTHPSRTLDGPSDLSVMYIEGHQHINGYEDAYDVEVVTEPACYGLVVLRHARREYWHGMETSKIEIVEVPIYLQSPLSFMDRVWLDGVMDLNKAAEIAYAFWIGLWPLTSYDEWYDNLEMEERSRTRRWEPVEESLVPDHVIQILNKTMDTVRNTVDSQFGQGKKFFTFPQTAEK